MDPDVFPATFDPLFAQAVQRILQGEPLEPFCDWFSREMGTLMQSEHPLPPGEEADAIRYQCCVARALWQAVPVPGNRWRPRPLPKLERNGPCHCGSGRKYKQCCAQFGNVPMPVDGGDMYMLALSHADPSMLSPDRVRDVPPEALGVAADAWNNERRPERTVAVLEPLFENCDRLDQRHEIAFDALMDARLMLGQETRRHALAQRVAECRDKELACTARCRLVTMLIDRGEEQAAWTMFQQTQRLHPDNPQLWQLELTLLHAQGRAEEARMRGTLLAVKARKAGLHELADVLARLGEQGLAMAFDSDANGDEIDDAEDAQWIELCEQAPAAFSSDDCRKLYRLERQAAEDGATPPTLGIAPTRKLADLQRRWSRRFGASKPMLTALQGDASALFDALPEPARFLREHADAWFSIEVLDDLLLAAADLCDEEAPVAVVRAARKVATHAVAVLRAVAGTEPVRLEWIDTASRPALRVLAQAIWLAQLMRDLPRVEELAAWGLQLNPNDNHGWRDVLATQWAAQGRFGEALDLMQRYPDDMPSMQHLRALALFALDRRPEAEALLRQAHGQYPRIIEFLLPDVMDAPPPEPGPGIAVGGTQEAWENRMETRAAWVRTGALEWARSLDLKARRTAGRKPAGPKKKAKSEVPAADAFTQDHERTLRKSFPDYARVHGLLTAVAWSPDLVMPAQWLEPVMALRAEPPANVQALNADMDALMRLYNTFNSRVLDTPPQEPPPVADALELADAGEPDAFAWAAGFVQGAELNAGAWRRVGRGLRSDKGAFAALFRLAARAPGAADGWRARNDEGQPMLAGLQDEPSAQETLRLALQDLWRVTGAARK